LPIKIHDLDAQDSALFGNELGQRHQKILEALKKELSIWIKANTGSPLQ
jgi:hypothetical protein